MLFGKVNPSGKLPLTFPAHENQTAMSPHQWPGWPDPSKPTYANYTEGLLVGYRYYDAHGLEPAYPFGHGLSYTSFAYSALDVAAGHANARSSVVVKCNVSNVGRVAGAEVAQLYLAFPAAAGEPPKVLRGFEKLTLAPGQSATVLFYLDAAKDMAIWNEATHAWQVVPGEYGVLVGSSSRDIRLVGRLSVPPAALVVEQP